MSDSTELAPRHSSSPMSSVAVTMRGSGYPLCHTYDSGTPILVLISEVFSLTITTADAGAITSEEVAFARALADHASRYARECARFAVRRAHQDAAGPDQS